MTTEVVDAFLDAMHAAGIVPVEDIRCKLSSGQPIYFDCHGDKPHTRKGWAILHLDGRPAGAFGHFKQNVKQTWRAKGPRRNVDPAERLRQRREIDANRREREAEREAAWLKVALRLRSNWEAAGAARPDHPYLTAKQVTGEGLRQNGNVLLVPMFGIDGAIWNIQRIWPDGRKLYAKGAKQKGLYLLLGEPIDSLAIAEGYGTGAVIRRATGFPVVIAFSWSNLASVAQMMRDRHSEADIIIGADDDAHLIDNPNIQKNIGLEAATAAARSIGGRVAIPPRGAA